MGDCFCIWVGGKRRGGGKKVSILRIDKKGVFIKDHFTREITMCEAACLSIWFG